MATRRRAREVVLQLLYQHDVNPEQDAATNDRFLTVRLLRDEPAVQFAKSMLKRILESRKLIDGEIQSRATNWNIRRMATVDRNILRMGAFEILHSDTPGQVAINEAIELAKRYGDRNSGSFVNGVLDRILRDISQSNQADPDENSRLEGEKPEKGQLQAL